MNDLLQRLVVFMALALLSIVVTCGVQAAPPSSCTGTRADGVDPALPAYRPEPFEVPSNASYVAPDGAVIVVGYNDMREMLHAMASTFGATHQSVKFRFDLPGTRFAPEALAKGKSAFAPMGAIVTPPQLRQYREITGGEPLAIRVAHASLDPHALSGPLAVFVHRDNPIQSLTLGQVAKVFTGEVTRWRELDLGGQWGNRSVNAYGMQEGTALAYELQRAVMPNQRFGKNVVGLPQSTELVDKIAADPSGIGFAAAMRVRPEVRAVAIAADERAQPILPTCESIIAGRYPLDRYLMIYLARPIPPVAREFVRFALSLEGQQAVAASPEGYLPLSAPDAAAELAKLE